MIFLQNFIRQHSVETVFFHKNFSIHFQFFFLFFSFTFTIKIQIGLHRFTKLTILSNYKLTSNKLIRSHKNK